MATYSASVAAHRKTLTANTVDTVTLTSVTRGARVDVVNHDASADLFVTTDGSAPAVQGASSYVVPAGGVLNLSLAVGKTVKLIAASAAAYTVQAAS